MKAARLLLRVFFAAVVVLITVCPALAKDEWIEVRSRNFFLIGNAPEKDIRKVAVRLEQFRESIQQAFNADLASPIPTNVVVFKSDASFRNFKPKRADGSIDDFISGYFRPDQDVNYIALSAEGDDIRTYETIFHEYVHFIVDMYLGKSNVPAWFSEGLAEYFSTFQIQDNQRVKLGLADSSHLSLLSQNKLIPLEELFGTSSYALNQAGNHSRSIFYAQSWALIHYLFHTGKDAALVSFLNMLLKNVPPEQAFQRAFQTSFVQMEAELKRYVAKGKFQYTVLTLGQKLSPDAGLRVARLSEAASNAYLGELLYRIGRADEAEPFLTGALSLDSSLGIANTTLGMVKARQGRFNEAKTYLERAIDADPKNFNANYQYAYVLSREGRDEFGFVQSFGPATASKIREALRKAIAINPAFTESYDLLAFVDLVNNEELDDALAQLNVALRYKPGNSRYVLRVAEVLLRQKKYREAQATAEQVARTAGDTETKARSADLLARISSEREDDERRAAEIKRVESLPAAGGVMLKRVEVSKPLTEAEILRQQEIAKLRSLNEALYKPAGGTERAIGHMQRIECKSKRVFFTIRTDSETFVLTSKDFNALNLKAFDSVAVGISLGCGADLSALKSVLTYRPAAGAASGVRGELIAIDFVPADFRFLTVEEIDGATFTVYPMPDGRQQSQATGATGETSSNTADLEAQRRSAVMQALRDAVRKPLTGERRDIGYLEKLECDQQNVFFYFRTATGIVKLLNISPESLKITFYTPDLGGLQLACGMQPVEFPAVFNYTDKPDPKTKAAGVIVSLEFMPKIFTLG